MQISRHYDCFFFIQTVSLLVYINELRLKINKDQFSKEYLKKEKSKQQKVHGTNLCPICHRMTSTNIN